MELASAVSEQVNADRSDGYRPEQIGARLLVRTALGVWNDIEWSHEHLSMGDRIRQSPRLLRAIIIAADFATAISRHLPMREQPEPPVGSRWVIYWAVRPFVRTSVFLRLMQVDLLIARANANEMTIERIKAEARAGATNLDVLLHTEDLAPEIRNSFERAHGALTKIGEIDVRPRHRSIFLRFADSVRFEEHPAPTARALEHDPIIREMFRSRLTRIRQMV